MAKEDTERSREAASELSLTSIDSENSLGVIAIGESGSSPDDNDVPCDSVVGAVVVADEDDDDVAVVVVGSGSTVNSTTFNGSAKTAHAFELRSSSKFWRASSNASLRAHVA